MKESQIISKIKENIAKFEGLYRQFDFDAVDELYEENRQLYKQLAEIKRQGLNGKRRYKINDKWFVECNSIEQAEEILRTQHQEEYKGGTIVEVDKNGNTWSGADFILIAVD